MRHPSKRKNQIIVFIISFALSLLFFGLVGYFLAGRSILSSPEPAISSPKASISTPSDVVASAKYGHFPYNEASRNAIIKIASYGQGDYQRYEYLHQDAAQALMRMINAARDQGVWIVPVSGFRDIERQHLLWQDQIQRRGSEEIAARSSAPPGHSEHHTGYAIDLADGSLPPPDDITSRFVDTPAFRWLEIHGRDFGFELSFPENNPQGVMYEPWHWRFVGTPAAEGVFRVARQSF